MLVDRSTWRALGVVVLCGDETRRFLPFGAAAVGADEIDVRSSLALVEDVDFYRARGESLRTLRGAAVDRDGRRLGTLRDLVLAPDGEVEALVVERGGAEVRVPLDETVSVAVASPASVA